MPSAVTTPSPSADLLSDETLHSLRRLRRAVASARGIFALFPVESDLSDAARDESWSYLRALLADHGLTIHILSLTESDWNPLPLVEKAGPFHADDIVLLTGFENTPGIADTRQRPQALAALNIDRELLEETLRVPLIFWGRPWLIRDLQRHAPDFYDHFSATFCISETNEGENNDSRVVTRSIVEPPSNSPFISRASAESAIAFYEAELGRHMNGSPEYIRAMHSLADALFDQSLLGAGGRDRADEFYQIVLQQSIASAESTAAVIMHQLGRIAEERRQFDVAEQWYLQSLEIAKRIGNERGEAITLHQLGTISEERRQFDVAEQWYLQSLEIAKRIGNESGEAKTLHQLGIIAQERRQFDAAEQWYLQSLKIERRIGDEYEEAITLHQLGRVAEERRHFDAAEQWYRQSLEIEKRIGDEHGEAQTLHQLGLIAQARRHFDEAEQWYRQSLEIEKRIGDEHGEAITLHQLGMIAEEHANLEDALALYKQAARTFELMNDPYTLAIAQRSLSRIAEKQKKEQKRQPRAKRK